LDCAQTCVELVDKNENAIPAHKAAGLKLKEIMRIELFFYE